MPTTEAPPAATEIRTANACAACRHDRDAHDRIGARFCSATIAGSLSRGCACVGDTPESVHWVR